MTVSQAKAGGLDVSDLEGVEKGDIVESIYAFLNAWLLFTLKLAMAIVVLSPEWESVFNYIFPPNDFPTVHRGHGSPLPKEFYLLNSEVQFLSPSSGKKLYFLFSFCSSSPICKTLKIYR